MPNVSPAATRAPRDASHHIQITDWKPYVKNTLRGFFTAELASGMIIHRLMLHQKNDARFITFPAQEYKDAKGDRQFAAIIEFRDKEVANRFRDTMIAALDRYFEDQEQPL